MLVGLTFKLYYALPSRTYTAAAFAGFSAIALCTYYFSLPVLSFAFLLTAVP